MIDMKSKNKYFKNIKDNLESMLELFPLPIIITKRYFFLKQICYGNRQYFSNSLLPRIHFVNVQINKEIK